MSNDGGGMWLSALGPTGAAALNWAIYLYYRNTNKSHAFERGSRVEVQPVTGSDVKTGDVEGVRNCRISGDNVKAYRDRVKRRR